MVTENTIREYAIKHGAKWPELVVAQWKLESGHGKMMSGKNNPYGLKGINTGTLKSTQEYYGPEPETIKDRFLDFQSQEEATQYLVERWYKNFKGYRGVNNAVTPEDAARMLQSEGYATDPRYAQKLIGLMTTQNVDLVNVAESYKGLEHQKLALRNLQSSLTPQQWSKLTADWRNDPTTPAVAPKPLAPKFPLNVPYFAQNDSKTNQGMRMCQSSAIAMRIKQIDARAIVDDDDYLRLVNRFGDTVSQAAHQKALNHLGFKHRFRQNGSQVDLLSLLDQGVAVPIGVLHKGPVSNPSGGGHWITLIGYDATHFWCHDPFGEMNVVNGNYVTNRVSSGRAIRYTRKNLMKRWLISSQSDGWLWEIRP